MEKILIDLGFKDITKEVPIAFIECLPIGFENALLNANENKILTIEYNTDTSAEHPVNI